MDIKPNSPESTPSPLRYDLTKRVRESIQARQPIEAPAAAEATEQQDAQDAAAKVKQARDEHRDQFNARVSNARTHYTENHTKENVAAVTKARDDYRGKLDVRKANVADAKLAAAKQRTSDAIDISKQSQKLVAEIAKTRQSDASERAARVAELKQKYLDGTLHTNELIDRSARRMIEPE